MSASHSRQDAGSRSNVVEHPRRRSWTPGAPRPLGLGHDKDLAPGWELFLTEPSRAAISIGLHAAGGRLLASLAPKPSDEQVRPVLMLPGLMTGDGSTWLTRRWLRRLGYQVHGWGLGRNIGPTPRVLSGLRHVMEDAVDKYQQPVSVIGWSLGGIFAREIAREEPEHVRQVITMGSPFRLAHPSETRALRAFERYSHLHVPVEELPPPESTRPDLQVPATSIYSTLDGVVSWRACLDAPGGERENIAVWGSHLGLGFNPAVLWAVADRLAQPLGGWRPFEAPRWASALYPTPGEYVSVLV